MKDTRVNGKYKNSRDEIKNSGKQMKNQFERKISPKLLKLDYIRLKYNLPYITKVPFAMKTFFFIFFVFSCPNVQSQNKYGRPR